MGCILEDDENVIFIVHTIIPNTVGVNSYHHVFTTPCFHSVFTTPCGTVTNMRIFSPYSRNISEKLKQKSAG